MLMKHEPLQEQLQPQHQEHHTLAHSDPAPELKPITLTLSRFSRDCTASVVFCLQDSTPTLAPWNSIYIPKHYRVPIPGQRQSSPGECDLVLKIFPRLALPDVNPETFRSQDVVSPCERCRAKKRDIFQVIGPDPALPSPQRLFFSTGEIRLFFKIGCPPSHHKNGQDDFGYILTFELHHGKRILMSETVRNAGPGMIPEPVETESVPLMVKPLKRKLSSPHQSWEPVEPVQDVNGSMPRKRSTVMSLANLISDNLLMVSGKAENPFTSAVVSVDPSSPTAAVVPLSPKSYQHEHEPAHMQPRSKNTSNDDHTPSSWAYNKAPKVATERGDEQYHPKPSAANGSEKLSAKPSKKRQEPHELSELGIGQRASANLHAAYVNGQLRERSKAGLSPEAAAALLASTENTARAKNASKPKPSHSCPEPDCDKSFSRLFNLRSHMRTHSKARPFVCADCNFAFSRRHDRDRHAKKHLSKKPYKCIVCEATFVRQDALVRHLRMDGVQNQCMAAMEQRSVQLGENGGGYMLAAKQQAYDEQQQEDQRDADEKQGDIRSQHNEIPGAEMEHADASSTAGDNGYRAGETRRVGGTEDGRADEMNSEATKAPESLQLSSETDSKDHDLTRVGSAAGEYHRKRETKDPSHSRQSSPRQERTGQDLGSTDKSIGHDVNKRHSHTMVPRYERPAHGAHQEHAGEDRFGSMSVSHPRTFYPSPSRSHSRSHSQSQPYSSTTEYHSPSYHESASSTSSVYSHPPSHGYHGSQSKYSSGVPHAHTYRDLQPNYAYQPTSSRYPERAHPSEPRGISSFSEQHSVDSFPPYPGHESTYDRVEEGPGAGSQSWTTIGGQETQGDLSELEMDKTIFEAAMGLLRIRASQW